MKGLLREALIFYLRSRVQRWFFALAALSMAVRVLVLRMPCSCNRAASVWYFLSLLPAIGFAGVSLMSSAAMFRMVSSLRTVFLIPRSRAQLIFGLLLAQIFVAALITLAAVALGAAPSGPLAWGSWRGTFEYTFGTATVAVVALQVIAGPSRLAALLAASLLLGLLARFDVFMQPEIAGAPTADAFALAGLVAWAVFAAWYLRAGPIIPVAAVWRLRRARPEAGRPAFSPASSAPALRSVALDAYLLGQPSLWLACRKQLIIWSLYVAMSGIVLGVRQHPPPRDFSALALLLLFYIPVSGNWLAGLVARRSRTLWLRSGESRAALFARGERLAWRTLALVGTPFLLAAAVAWHFLPHLQFAAAYPVAVVVSLAPCGIYLGLLNFTRTSDLTFVVLYLIVALGGVVAVLSQSTPTGAAMRVLPSACWALPLGLAVLAVVLRRVAKRRWLTIDWLRYRAPRTASSVIRI